MIKRYQEDDPFVAFGEEEDGTWVKWEEVFRLLVMMIHSCGGQIEVPKNVCLLDFDNIELITDEFHDKTVYRLKTHKSNYMNGDNNGK